MKLSKSVPTYPQIKVDEDNFAKNLVDFKGNAYTSTPSKDYNATYIRRSDNHFYLSTPPKKYITLHHTMGFLSNDIVNLTSSKVSVPFTIDTQGRIYQLFNPKYWAYHIGSSPKKSSWENTTLSKITIGIELCNFGPLIEDPNNPNLLRDYWGFLYCTKDNQEAYKKVSYRGYDYYAAYTDAQYKALDSLLLKLCREFNIPHTFLHHTKRFDFMYDIPKAGIWSHSNVRKDKYDLSPAFDFRRISGR